jgi:cytochrome c oxidase subunit 2
MKSQKSKVKSLGILFSFIVYSLWFMTASAQAEERIFEIKAKKFSYTPNIINVNRGDTVKIRLLSEDVHHGLFLDGYGIRTSAHPGMDGSLKFVADKPGRHTFRCSVTCGEFHPYMVGYLVVGPNSRFWLYAAVVLAIGIGSALRVKKANG